MNTNYKFKIHDINIFEYIFIYIWKRSHRLSSLALNNNIKIIFINPSCSSLKHRSFFFLKYVYISAKNLGIKALTLFPSSYYEINHNNASTFLKHSFTVIYVKFERKFTEPYIRQMMQNFLLKEKWGTEFNNRKTN